MEQAQSGGRFASRPGIPYEGELPYVFVSYRHSAWAQVYPIIRWLMNQGIRVWYDEGIEGGSEWRGVIQDHVEGCTIFIPFITADYCDSSNCRRELSIADEDQKIIIPIYLEKTKLRHGLRTILADTQGIFKFEIPNDELFIERLVSFSALKLVQDADGGNNDDLWADVETSFGNTHDKLLSVDVATLSGDALDSYHEQLFSINPEDLSSESRNLFYNRFLAVDTESFSHGKFAKYRDALLKIQPEDLSESMLPTFITRHKQCIARFKKIIDEHERSK